MNKESESESEQVYSVIRSHMRSLRQLVPNMSSGTSEDIKFCLSVCLSCLAEHITLGFYSLTCIHALQYCLSLAFIELKQSTRKKKKKEQQ